MPNTKEGVPDEMTISTSTVERLVDLMLDIKSELKGDIARVDGKVDEALAILKRMDARLIKMERKR